jgi:hypothetical protein
MRLMKRDETSGLILTVLDTDIMTDEERVAVSDELHDLIVECKCREAAAITDCGVDVQIDYLTAQRGQDALTDVILEVLDSADNWRSWK